jgi:hypothetical protein
VTHRYKLIRPIVCFCKTDRKVLTIPAGETVSLDPSKVTVGVCDAIWNDRPIFVFREDVEQNAMVSIGEMGHLGEFVE